MTRHAGWTRTVWLLSRLGMTAFLASTLGISASANSISGPTGKFGAVREYDPGVAPAQTVYRPRDLGVGGFPIIVWGNGGCAADGGATSRQFLLQVASEGYVIVAPGKPGPDVPIGPTSNVEAPSDHGASSPAAAPLVSRAGPIGAPWPTSPRQLVIALDWLVKEGSRRNSPYFGKLAVKQVAVMAPVHYWDTDIR